MKLYEVFLLNEGKRERLQMLERTMEFADEMNLRIIDRQMSEINQNFDREDVKIWLTRILRAEVLSRILDNSRNSLGRASPELSKYVQKIISNSELESRIITNQLSLFIGTLEQASHFLSLPINEIQEYRFSSYELPSEIFREFEEIEREWQENIKDLIPYNNESVIMDFGDGFAWYDLENAACDAEAGAMGHCGNAPSADNPNETIFSLRERKEIGGNIYVKPYLTFIFDTQTRMFGEMKGRANEKPAERYHQYIIPLIMEEWVEGLQGGGFMPESNFKITDVSGWERFVKEKPGLLELGEYVQHFGVDEHVDKKVIFFNESGSDVYIEEGDETRVSNTLNNMRRMIRDEMVDNATLNHVSRNLHNILQESFKNSSRTEELLQIIDEKFHEDLPNDPSTILYFLSNNYILDRFKTNLEFDITNKIYREAEEEIQETLDTNMYYTTSLVVIDENMRDFEFDPKFSDSIYFDVIELDGSGVTAHMKKDRLIRDMAYNGFTFDHEGVLDVEILELDIEPEEDDYDIIDRIVETLPSEDPDFIVDLVIEGVRD